MKSLVTKIPSPLYAYVKESVIFNIKTVKDDDACVMPIDENTTPYIVVKEGASGADVRWYFVNFIEDGDTSGETQGNIYAGKFLKTIHKKSGDESKTFQDYYRDECENTIGEAIINNYTLGYEDFVDQPSRLGVPRFMLEFGVPADSNYSVSGITKISLRAEDYNNYKNKEVRKKALASAEQTANKYGYEVILGNDDCFKVEEITE